MKKMFALALCICFLFLLSGCGGDPLDVEIACNGETDELGNSYFTVQTNLPDDTNLIITVSGISSDESNFTNINYRAQSEATVSDGTAVVGPFRNGVSPLIMGEYVVNITMPLANVQSEAVQDIIGKNGKNLRGDSVVALEEGGNYVEFETAWEMENLSQDLSPREISLLRGGIAAVDLYRSLSAHDEAVEVHFTEFYFSKAVVSDLSGELAMDNTLAVDDLGALIDYTAKTHDFDTEKEFEQNEEDAFLSFEELDGYPQGIIIDNFSSVSSVSIMYNDTAVQSGIAYSYTEDELQRINLALNQFIGWLEFELPTAEDFINYEKSS